MEGKEPEAKRVVGSGLVNLVSLSALGPRSFVWSENVHVSVQPNDCGCELPLKQNCAKGKANLIHIMT